MRTEKRNYLTSVIFRIDFDDPMKFSSDDIEKVKAKINDRLSEWEKKQMETIQVSMSSDEQKTVRIKNDYYEFTNEGKSEIVHIDENFLWFDIKKYKDFKYFKKLIEDVLNILDFKGKSKRLGLRDINQITIDEGDPFDWKGWININLINGFDFVDKKDSLARTIGIISYNFNDFVMKFQYGMYNSEFPNTISKREFVLDYDCSTKESRDMIETLDLFDKMHELVEEKFYNSIDIELKNQIEVSPS